MADSTPTPSDTPTVLPTPVVPLTPVAPPTRPVIDGRLVTLTEDLEASVALQRDWVAGWVRTTHPTHLLALADLVDPDAEAPLPDGHQRRAIFGLARLALTDALLGLFQGNPALS